MPHSTEAVLTVALILIFALIVLTIYLTARVRYLSHELNELRGSSQVLAQLAARVHRLEHPVSEPPPEPVQHEQPPPLPVPEPQPQSAAPGPAVNAPREDWEAVVGGNWLNKLGVLILVVGIALFLGYGVTQLGPTGRIAIGFLVGCALLTAGVLIEKKPRYLTYGRGLIGGGWAAIYFTAYAMHGLDAARVIADPFLGTAILLGVSIAILLHSFSYRSEPATVLAYFVVFVSLNLSPLTAFSAIAALVLALSLIVTAFRFYWLRLAAAGILFTYVTFALRYEPAVYGQSGLFNGQSILCIYWLAFETYDLLSLRRGGSRNSAASILNASGFILASLMHQSTMQAHDWSRFLTAAGVAYLASMLIRERMRGDTRFAFTTSAMLFAGAILEGLSGLRVTTALAIEGEIVFMAGIVRNDPYAKALGSLILALPFIHLYTTDIPKTETTSVLGHKMDAATPLTFILAAVFYANRFAAGGGWYFATAASILVATVIQLEVATHWVAVVWALMTLGAVWLGIRRNDRGLVIQSYLLAVATFARVCIVNYEAASATRIPTVSIVVACFYCAHFLEKAARPLFSVLGTALLTFLLVAEVQGRLLTVALGIEGVGLLLAGFWLRERTFRLSGLTLFLFCIGKLFVYDLRQLDTLSRIFSFIILGLLLLGASWVYTRFREQIRRLL
jgi:uncharacterized membrane protein